MPTIIDKMSVCIIDNCDRPSRCRRMCKKHYSRWAYRGGDAVVDMRFTQQGYGNRKTPAPEYLIWRDMIRRCTDPRRRCYRHYGGRGIAVCERWRQSFTAFLEHVGPRPSPSHSIDRINNDGNYEPGNVRWATAKEQARNHRNTRKVTIDGVTRPAVEWAEMSGVNTGTARSRLQRGGDPAQAVTEPPNPKPSAILTAEEVLIIRRRHAAGESQASLEREFRLSPRSAWAIVHRKSWREL